MTGNTGSIREVNVVLSMGHCFLCLEKVKEVTGAPGGQGTIIAAMHSVQKLCRHLKLDLSNALLNNEEEVDKQVGGVPPQPLKGHPDMKVELCGECVHLTEAFEEAFQELEEARLKVASILGGIHGKFLGAEESGRSDQSRKLKRDAKLNIGGGDPNGPMTMIGKLRMKMMNKCAGKLRGVGLPSPTQSKGLPSEKVRDVEETEGADSNTAVSTCEDLEDGLINYQLVGVYDFKVEPPEYPNAVPEADDNRSLATNGFVSMEADDPFMGAIISGADKAHAEASPRNNLESEMNGDRRDHSQVQGFVSGNPGPGVPNRVLHDIPLGQVIEMINVKLEPEEQIPIPEEDGEAFPNNGLEGESGDMAHNSQDHFHSSMDSSMEVTTSSGYGSSDSSPLLQQINDPCSSSSSTRIQSAPGPLESNGPEVRHPGISMKCLIEQFVSLKRETVKSSSSAPVEAVAVPHPRRVFLGDGYHNKPQRKQFPLPVPGEKYKCCCCPEEYGHYGGLYGHHRSVHLGERFICPWPGCKMSCSRQPYYRTHYRSVHLGVPVQGQRRSVQGMGRRQL